MNGIFEKGNYDGVFHLAAQSHPPTSFADPSGTFETNTVGTVNIANAIQKHSPKTKLMFCSTSEVYGAVPREKQPISEESPIDPVNPYGVSKAGADHYVRERSISTNLQLEKGITNEALDFFVTRAFSHTGTRRGRNFSISSDAYQITRIIKGLQKPTIRVGNLESERVVMDVRDCVRAYGMLMGTFTPGEAYNVGGDEFFSMGEILHKMLKMKGLEGKVEIFRDKKLIRPIDIPIQICDTSKLKDLTGWKPEIPIDQTLINLLDYWDKKIQP